MSDAPVRAVHFTNAWHSTSGGIRTFYTALLDQAEACGRQMTLVVPGERDSLVERGACTRVYTVASPQAPSALDHRYRVVRPHRFLFARSRIQAILRDQRPDLIEVSDKYTLCYLAGAIKRRRGPRPTLIGLSHERMDDTMAAHCGGARWSRAFARWYIPAVYLRQFDAHIANSAYTADELRAAASSGGPGAPLLWRLRDRIFVLPPGADTRGFAPAHRSATMRSRLLAHAGGSPSSILLVFAGRLSAEKFAGDLIPALHFIIQKGIDARLVIAGDGPERWSIERDAAQFLPGRCAVLGHIADRLELARVLAGADVFLHPNPREPFGIGPLEAMASGVPVVLPGRGGVLSYASDETAWLATPGPAGLANAVVECLQQPAEARRRIRNGVRCAQAFNWEATAARYFEAYDAIHTRRRMSWLAA